MKTTTIGNIEVSSSRKSHSRRVGASRWERASYASTVFTFRVASTGAYILADASLGRSVHIDNAETAKTIATELDRCSSLKTV